MRLIKTHERYGGLPASGHRHSLALCLLLTGVADSESYGIGVRTIVNGSWGFAATNNMTMKAW